MELLINKKFEPTVYFVSKENALNFLTNDVNQFIENKFKADFKQDFVYIGPNTDNIVLVGIGSEENITNDKLIEASYFITKKLNKLNIKNASYKIPEIKKIKDTVSFQSIAEGVLQAQYIFDQYKKEKTIFSLETIGLMTPLADADQLLNEIISLIDSVNLTRDLVNTPANDLYPEILETKVKKIFSDSNVDIKIYDKGQLEKLGADALLAVAKGSVREPRLIVLEYSPLGQDHPSITLVGKGVTYDSGGYAIKNTQGMATMKADMAGAGAVIGAFHAIVKNNIQQNVTAVIGATENMISGEAFKNGDIISSLKGTTIEVMNTDAEGRLVLADALYYAATEIKSKYIIDAATLTGAAIAALGPNVIATMTNNLALLEKINSAAQHTGETVWQLPIFDEHHENIKGKHSDLVNIALNYTGAGTSIAAAFLEEFVEDTPWVHLDIAGPSYRSNTGVKYLPGGASGVPVKTMYQFVKDSVK